MSSDVVVEGVVVSAAGAGAAAALVLLKRCWYDPRRMV